MAKQQVSYGAWPSPISAKDLVAGASIPTDLWAEAGRTWWSQTRPDEGGRIQVVRRDPDGSVHDVLPAGWNARTRVHEYGGGAWWVHDGVVFATSWTDQRLYRAAPGAEPLALTPEPAEPHALRYADGRVTPDGRTIVCVREAHVGHDVRNEIVAMAADALSEPVVLFTGTDFVAAPRASADGRRLAWLSWDHPNMPWDDTTLWVGELNADGANSTLSTIRRVAGGQDESLVQPEWTPRGELLVVSDRTDWWNVYRVDDVDGEPSLTGLHDLAAEVGVPAWGFGQSRYVSFEDGAVWFTYSNADGAHLVRVDDGGGVADDVLPYLSLLALRADGERLVALASQAVAESVVIEIGPRPSVNTTVLRAPRDLGLDPGSIARPRHVAFPTAGGETAYAWIYEPANADVEGPPAERPPLVVTVHGGPTGSADPAFRLSVQYWSTRGFAIADIDYRGSTGYGRAYRKLLDDAWGVADVDDACHAALWLAEQGVVDAERLAIRGGSAGGFTVLAALAERDVFATGANYFGVADLAALATDTHKFESRYLDRLVGPWPEAAAVYAERSPLSHIDGFDRPLIVFQGDEDAIVPPSQSEMIVDALAAKHIPHAYLLFAGEQHGFRRAENIVRATESELSFFAQVFGFVPAGDIEAVPIIDIDRLHA
jgi:dipeptidyl aminopeptidase/acylaminoacyl peptidase